MNLCCAPSYVYSCSSLVRACSIIAVQGYILQNKNKKNDEKIQFMPLLLLLFKEWVFIPSLKKKNVRPCVNYTVVIDNNNMYKYIIMYRSSFLQNILSSICSHILWIFKKKKCILLHASRLHRRRDCRPRTERTTAAVAEPLAAARRRRWWKCSASTLYVTEQGG